MVNPNGAFAQPQEQKRKLLLYHYTYFHSDEGAKNKSKTESTARQRSLFNVWHFDPWSHHISNPGTFLHDQILALCCWGWLTSSLLCPLGLPLLRRNSCVTQRTCWGCALVKHSIWTRCSRGHANPGRLGWSNGAYCAVSHSDSFPFQTFIHFGQTTHP